MREKYIKVRLSAAEMKRLKDLAYVNGLTVSSFVRLLIQNYKNGGQKLDWLIDKQRKEDEKR